MTTAYSGLMDTDMASEMTEYTQQNILEPGCCFGVITGK